MYDTIIIGSGPAGMTAAIYACRAKLNFVVIERIQGGTGQISEGGKVENYPGMLGISGFDLGEKIRSHAMSLGTDFIEGEAVRIEPVNSGYRVTLADGSSLEALTVIYAAGASHRRLDVKGEGEFVGRGVSYCAACDGAFYKNKTVAVVGGGDTAFGDAMILSRIAGKVYIIHRREQFRANMKLQERVKNTPNIEFCLNATVTEISGDEFVESVNISQNGNVFTLDADGVFIAVGEKPDSELLRDIADIDGHGFVVAGENGVTSAKGIFAAGDVRTKEFRQVITAAADGANCIKSVEEFLSMSNDSRSNKQRDKAEH